MGEQGTGDTDRDKLAEQLEKVTKEFRDFSYIISHDLKAPLRGIKALADWLSEDYSDKLDDDGREQMALLVKRVNRMHNLLDGVLEYSRVGRVQEEHAQINLNELLTEIIDMASVPENIKVTVDENMPTIICEEKCVIQIFENLIKNAVTYMDKDQGTVHISFADDGESWKFSVKDNGPGIPEDQFEKIFKIFQTLQAKDEFESTGVGLTIVKKIVEMYGGKVWPESTIGEGTTFYFTLPKKIAVTQDSPAEATTAN